jgi:hypothetical protein
MLLICSAPIDDGYIPVMIAVRAGAHTGNVDHAFRYIVPRAASASRCGVSAFASP